MPPCGACAACVASAQGRGSPARLDQPYMPAACTSKPPFADGGPGRCGQVVMQQPTGFIRAVNGAFVDDACNEFWPVGWNSCAPACMVL